MDPEDRQALVLRHTTEAVTEDEVAGLLGAEESPRVYIGYAPTGRMHIGHFTTIRKLVDFLDAGLPVTVLIADLHAHLDDAKSPFELLDARSRYYRLAIEAMVDATGGDSSEIEFVRGTEFELDRPYTLDLYRLTAETTTARAQRAGSEVVRQRDSPTMGSLLYSLMQALDVAALDADIAYGGIDQRGIYMLAREVLPTIGKAKPACLFAPLLSGLTGGKMSASEHASTVNLVDDPETIAARIGDAYCPAGSTEDNGVLEYLEHLVFPAMVTPDTPFVIDRPDEYGGTVSFQAYDDLEAAFVEGDLHPQDLKGATAQAIAALLRPVRERLLDDPAVLAAAYPERFDA